MQFHTIPASCVLLMTTPKGRRPLHRLSHNSNIREEFASHELSNMVNTTPAKCLKKCKWTKEIFFIAAPLILLCDERSRYSLTFSFISRRRYVFNVNSRTGATRPEIFSCDLLCLGMANEFIRHLQDPSLFENAWSFWLS